MPFHRSLPAARAIALVSVFASVFAAPAFLSACVQKQSEPSGAASSGIRKGHPALAFDYEAAREIFISRFDPFVGDSWDARVTRATDARTTRAAAGGDHWKLEQGPDGSQLSDSLANGAFILHLLDTARTLQLTEAKVSGTPESFGLARPLFFVRWKVATPGGSDHEYAIQLGLPSKSAEGKFEGLYGQIVSSPEADDELKKKVWVMNGSFLQMLDRVKSFDSLRLRTLATFTSDDVDEIEIRDPRGKRILSAQRAGDGWVSGKKEVPGAGELVDRLTHLQIMRFVDSTSAPKLSPPPLYAIRFKGRHGLDATLRFSRARGQSGLFATISTRAAKNGLAVFEVYPEALASIATVGR